MRWLVTALVSALVIGACSSGPGAVSPVGTSVTSDATVGSRSSLPAVTTGNPENIAYGSDPSQFGQLWRPADTSTPAPVVVLIHGGFWRKQYGLDLMDGLAADLITRGFAVWNIEYRRVGQDGGGYPGTLTDVAAAIDALAGFAGDRDLDLTDVVFVGHSAGGQLALWAAGRAALPAGAPGAQPVVSPRLAIGQGPVVDLVAGDQQGLGGGAVTDFIGGPADEFPDRYAIASPSTVSGVPLAIVRGTEDHIVPAVFTLPADPAQAALISVVDVDGADHFALIDPVSRAWQAVIALIGGSSVTG